MQRLFLSLILYTCYLFWFVFFLNNFSDEKNFKKTIKKLLIKVKNNQRTVKRSRKKKEEKLKTTKMGVKQCPELEHF